MPWFCASRDAYYPCSVPGACWCWPCS
jgi:hypothetical protein